jgi:hypothetical protein
VYIRKEKANRHASNIDIIRTYIKTSFQNKIDANKKVVQKRKANKRLYKKKIEKSVKKKKEIKKEQQRL